jgi:hypothetical protein
MIPQREEKLMNTPALLLSTIDTYLLHGMRRRLDREDGRQREALGRKYPKILCWKFIT